MPPGFRLLDRAIVVVQFLLPILGLLLFWELAVRTGLAQASILPAPSTILARAVELLGLTGERAVLFGHIGASLKRALLAFALAVAVGVPLGFLLGLSREAQLWVSPILSLMLPLPAVAWTPILLVVFGPGDLTIVIVCFLGAVFPVLYSTMQGVRACGTQPVWVVRSMGGSRLDVLRRVLIPASLPALITGFKLGMAHSWRTLVAAEMLAALSSGLGYMIFSARSYMDVSTMFVGVVCLAAIGMAIEHLLFGTLERATIHRWYARDAGTGGRQ
ncbi:ABC transporter permease [Cereibacter sphaeroides]|uniref:ABC transporter permease n=1 Tax=Cereibacter sphaeroides TaxID=1063 RepID=UPI003990605A